MKKNIVLCVGFLAACTSFQNETAVMTQARQQIDLQVKYADFAQSYINHPQTSVQSLMGWKLDDKIKIRNTNIEGCLKNTRLYNKAAGQAVLDEERCYPYCYSTNPKVCYDGHFKY